MPEIEVPRTVNVTRYVTPLREGGSLPAIAEADDGFLYALKFRGAGQGIKSLVAELIGGEIVRAGGLKVPEIVFANLNGAFGRSEPDEEIQDLLKASTGLNIALHYLSGAVSFDPAVHRVNPSVASRAVWLDAFLTNMDRTARNTNMLMWQKELWMIDHGACLYFHHAWSDWQKAALNPFPLIKDHVLLPFASELNETNEQMQSLITTALIEKAVSFLPQDWMDICQPGTDAAGARKVYIDFLCARLQNSSIFVNAAIDARNGTI